MVDLTKTKAAKTIYCVGNPDIAEDAVALELAKEFSEKPIQGFNFEILKHPEIMLNLTGDLILMDVVKGISEVEIIDDVSKLRKRNITTLHDFDAGMMLQIMKEVGTLKSIRIIALPFGKKKDELKEEAIEAIGLLKNTGTSF